MNPQPQWVEQNQTLSEALRVRKQACVDSEAHWRRFISPRVAKKMATQSGGRR